MGPTQWSSTSYKHVTVFCYTLRHNKQCCCWCWWQRGRILLWEKKLIMKSMLVCNCGICVLPCITYCCFRILPCLPPYNNASIVTCKKRSVKLFLNLEVVELNTDTVKTIFQGSYNNNLLMFLSKEVPIMIMMMRMIMIMMVIIMMMIIMMIMMMMVSW